MVVRCRGTVVVLVSDDSDSGAVRITFRVGDRRSVGLWTLSREEDSHRRFQPLSALVHDSGGEKVGFSVPVGELCDRYPVLGEDRTGCGHSVGQVGVAIAVLVGSVLALTRNLAGVVLWDDRERCLRLGKSLGKCVRELGGPDHDANSASVQSHSTISSITVRFTC